MTASSVEVTPGSGAKLAANSYTEGAVTVYSQNMINGEQYLPDYAIPTVTAVSLATANSHPIQVMAGASLRVRIRRVEIYQFGLATTAAFAQCHLIRLTTAGTGGSVLGINPIDPADAAAGLTSMTLPTVKGTEGSIVWNGSIYLAQTASASTPLNQPILVVDYDKPRTKPLIIAAGATNGIAFKNVTAIAAATVFIMVYASESSF